MTDRSERRLCGAIVVLMALTSLANLGLTIRLTNSIQARVIQAAELRQRQDERLARIEAKLTDIDADLDTHAAIMTDLETLRKEVKQLKARR